MSWKRRLFALPFIALSGIYAWYAVPAVWNKLLFGSALYPNGLPLRDYLFQYALAGPAVAMLAAAACVICGFARSFFWSKLAVASAVLAPESVLACMPFDPLFCLYLAVCASICLGIVFSRRLSLLLLLSSLVFMLLSLLLVPVWIGMSCLLYLAVLEHWSAPEAPAAAQGSAVAKGV